MPPAAALRLYGECPTDGLTFKNSQLEARKALAFRAFFVCTPKRRGGEVVTQRSAKPLCKGSIPFRASKRKEKAVTGPSLTMASSIEIGSRRTERDLLHG